jgi:hypothetical protein
VLGFHLDLVFPDEVNGETVSASIDKVCRDVHVAQSDFRFLLHKAATYMTNAASGTPGVCNNHICPCCMVESKSK